MGTLKGKNQSSELIARKNVVFSGIPGEEGAEMQEFTGKPRRVGKSESIISYYYFGGTNRQDVCLLM